jgi:hypothetical protein
MCLSGQCGRIPSRGWRFRMPTCSRWPVPSPCARRSNTATRGAGPEAQINFHQLTLCQWWVLLLLPAEYWTAPGNGVSSPTHCEVWGCRLGLLRPMLFRSALFRLAARNGVGVWSHHDLADCGRSPLRVCTHVVRCRTGLPQNAPRLPQNRLALRVPVAGWGPRSQVSS